MTNRELFHAIMSFRKPDRIPYWLLEEISGQAERVWYAAGKLPLGMRATDIIKPDVKIFSTFKMSDQPPIPSFMTKTVSDTGRYTVTQDIFGNTVKTLTHQTVTPTQYHYVGAPLKEKKDWEEMKKRYDPDDMRRYPLCWDEGMFAHYNQSPDPVIISMSWGPSRGIKNGYMFGFERLMEIYMDEPEILEDMFDFWADFSVRFLTKFTDKMKIDAFVFMDDGMGYKTSTIISPKLFRRVYQPYMRRVTDFLRSRGVEVIAYYSSGNLLPLINNLLETGINCIAPMECAAGMDAIKLRKEYGRDLLMMGNLSRDAVSRGREAIRQEVLRKVPYLMESGGYIPALDDMVFPDMDLENVKYCADLVRNIDL